MAPNPPRSKELQARGAVRGREWFDLNAAQNYAMDVAAKQEVGSRAVKVRKSLMIGDMLARPATLDSRSVAAAVQDIREVLERAMESRDAPAAQRLALDTWAKLDECASLAEACVNLQTKRLKSSLPRLAEDIYRDLHEMIVEATRNDENPVHPATVDVAVRVLGELTAEIGAVELESRISDGPNGRISITIESLERPACRVQWMVAATDLAYPTVSMVAIERRRDSNTPRVIRFYRNAADAIRSAVQVLSPGKSFR